MEIKTIEEFIKDRYDLNSEQLEKIKENMSKMPMIDFDNIPDLMESYAKYILDYASENVEVEINIIHDKQMYAVNLAGIEAYVLKGEFNKIKELIK